MPKHREVRVLPFRRDQFFDLVADVESYPKFVPLWRYARVYRREGSVYYTEQQVGAGPLMTQKFKSRTVFDRPSNIAITSNDGIFKDFRIVWQFESPTHDSCRVDFHLSCTAKSPLARKFMDMMLLETARQMVVAFESRAHQLLSPTSGNTSGY